MIENTISINSTEALDSVSDNTESETKVQKNNQTVNDENTPCETVTDSGKEGDSSMGTAENSGADQPEETVELTVYGEKRKVPLSQAVAVAQKGLAFEHLKAELADMKNDFRLKALEEIAKQSGKNTYQLVADLQHRAVTENLIERYGSLKDAPLEELGQAINTLMASRSQLKDGQNMSEYHRWKNQLREFAEANPGCVEIPEEVVQAAKKGENLSLAYSRIYGNRLTQEIKEAKRELDVLKSESKAVKNSTPSAKSVGGNENLKENEFLKLMKSTW